MRKSNPFKLNENDFSMFSTEMLRNEAIQEWPEACQTDSDQSEIHGAWRNVSNEGTDIELSGPQG